MTKEWLDRVAQTALCYRETLEATYDIATSLLSRGIPGDFVECGVFAGSHCAVMARAIMDYNLHVRANERPDVRSTARDLRGMRVHLFDSFTGIPQAGPNDIEFLEAGKKPGESTCSRAQVEAYMKEWGIPSELLVYHEGLFSETIPTFVLAANLIKVPIALLRLDGDLYESTKVCVEYLLPLVSRGGWVCVDDFNLSGCRQALLEKVVPAPIYWRIPTK
jgi:O-methyltransferase